VILLVIEDVNTGDAVQIINQAVYTGHCGDGKIFISPVEEAYTVRTGHSGL